MSKTFESLVRETDEIIKNTIQELNDSLQSLIYENDWDDDVYIYIRFEDIVVELNKNLEGKEELISYLKSIGFLFLDESKAYERWSYEGL